MNPAAAKSPARVPLLVSVALVAAFAALLLGPGAAWAQKPPRDPSEELFVAKCSSCHTVGAGARVGPDLKGTLDKRDRAWLEQFVAAPSKLLDTDPVARTLLGEYKGVRMPDLGLSAAQVKSLVDLIGRCSSKPCDLTATFTPANKATAADIGAGRALFIGDTPLKNGAAPCMSCHTVTGIGAFPGGGTLARDISQSFARLGDEGIDAALKSPPFPLMNKVFADHPLDPQEAFALRAFLYDRNRAAPDPKSQNGVLIAGVLIAAAVLVLLRAVWARQRGEGETILQPRA